MIAYTGNSAYCFTHSLHMSLKAAGATNLPEPGFLECLTLMPFGLTFIEGSDGVFFYPNSRTIEPDAGVTIALKTLGWACEEARDGTYDEALTRLQTALTSGPVMIGPADMGYLAYDPNYRFLSGEDHYVVVLGMEGNCVRVHDPARFPFATIPLDEFMQAWEASRVSYGPMAKTLRYVMRWNFRQIESIDRSRMIERTLARLRSRPQLSAIPGIHDGPQAAQALASYLQSDATKEGLRGLLVHFSLPLGARRCVDAAGFMLEAGLAGVAECLEQIAMLYGETQYYAVQEQWEAAAEVMLRMADAQRAFVDAL